MNNDMKKDILAQAKKTCAAYKDGMCMQDDCLCHILHPDYSIADGGIDCDYYLTAVLPSDRELFDQVQAEIYQTRTTSSISTKKCARCAKPFIPRNNRQKYCSTCGVEAEKKHHVSRQRKLYWKGKT